MTGGEVLVLGDTGRNFGAGMSGGYAYVLDFDERKCNTGLVEVRPASGEDLGRIKALIESHVLHTDSRKGRHLLDNWQHFINRFSKIVPIAYEQMMNAIAGYEAKGQSHEEAQLSAFKDKYK